jgi:hypothetical protein
MNMISLQSRTLLFSFLCTTTLWGMEKAETVISGVIAQKIEFLKKEKNCIFQKIETAKDLYRYKKAALSPETVSAISTQLSSLSGEILTATQYNYPDRTTASRIFGSATLVLGLSLLAWRNHFFVPRIIATFATLCGFAAAERNRILRNRLFKARTDNSNWIQENQK